MKKMIFDHNPPIHTRSMGSQVWKRSITQLKTLRDGLQHRSSKRHPSYLPIISQMIMCTLPMENRRLKEFHLCEGIRSVHWRILLFVLDQWELPPRLEILKLHTANNPLATDVDVADCRKDRKVHWGRSSRGCPYSSNDSSARACFEIQIHRRSQKTRLGNQGYSERLRQSARENKTLRPRRKGLWQNHLIVNPYRDANLSRWRSKVYGIGIVIALSNTTRTRDLFPLILVASANAFCKSW